MKRRDFGRWRLATPSASQMVRNVLAKRHINISDARAEEFLCWMFDIYHNDIMDKKITVTNEINAVQISLPNGTHGKPYSSGLIVIPKGEAYDFKVLGLDDDQLKIIGEKEDDTSYSFSIQGTPSATGDITLCITCKYPGWHDELPLAERLVRFTVNPNPRSLWRNIPTDPGVTYFKPDQESEYVDVPSGKDMVAASNRGRSHAQEGKPRDDHFMLFHCPESDWYIMAVADGAGSAKYSRKGSEIACRTSVDYCKEKLLNDNTLEQAVIRYQADEQDQGACTLVRNMVYSIVGNAAFLAHKAINEAAKAVPDGARPKDFATTLMLAICKKFPFGWFFASFWVGDGAIAIYDRDAHQASLLGTPDEGEFSGQTRFLTMPEIFEPNSLMRRLRFGIRPDFTALMLMTDGVSDPMFGTDASLNNPDKWDQLWTLLKTGFPDDNIGGVDLTADNEKAKDQLLGWLDFWMPGEHDDRTIAILY